MWSINLLEAMLLHWSRNWENTPIWTANEEDVEDIADCNMSEMASLTSLFFLESTELPDAHAEDFLPTWQFSILAFIWGYFANSTQPESDIGHF